MSQVLKESLAKNAKDAKVFLGELGVLARENIFSCFVSLRHGLARYERDYFSLAPDLHSCRPRPQRFFLASFASLRETLLKFSSFDMKLTTQGILVLLISLLSTPLHATSLDSFLSGLKTMQADFVQSVESQGGSQSITQSGVFYLKRPGKFRWDYTGKDAQLIVADGRTVWLQDRDLEQVSHQPQKMALRGTPAQLLSQGERVDRHFTVLREYQRDELEWMALAPVDKDSQVEEVDVAFRDNKLIKLEMTDKLGQHTRFSFSNVQRNPTLSKSLFKFKAPPGFDVWEH
jgi:outer membrane lipoprotein carrier protein